MFSCTHKMPRFLLAELFCSVIKSKNAFLYDYCFVFCFSVAFLATCEAVLVERSGCVLCVCWESWTRSQQHCG